MKFNKKTKSAVVIYAIIALIFILLTVIIPFPKPAASWVMFAFGIVSIIGGCGISIYAFGKSEELKSKFYGYPIFRIGFLYTVIQIILCCVIYVIGGFVNVPYWVGLVLSILVVGAAGIGFITTDNVRDYVENIDANTVIETKKIRKFNVDIAEILDICNNQEVYEPLKKLVEKFKYSDCVSSDATEEKEEEIRKEIEILKSIINTESTEKVIEEINKISNLLSTRNRICEASK